MFEAITFLPTAPDSSLLYSASYQPGWVLVSVLLPMRWPNWSGQQSAAWPLAWARGRCTLLACWR